MAVKLLQDIHLSDEELWSNFQDYWDNGNYIAAVNLLNANQQLVTKYVSANWLNGLTTLVYILENNSDPMFKADRIMLSYIPPSLNTGQIFFQIENSNTIISVYVDTINVSDTSVTISYDNTLISFMAFQNLQQVETEISFTGEQNGGTVTFAIGETSEDSITCLVFSSDAVILNMETITYPTNILTKSFNGELLNAFIYSGQNVCMCDIIINNEGVTFSIPQIEQGDTFVCRIVSIDDSYIDDGVNYDSGILSTNSFSKTLNCSGYLINHILTQNNSVVKTDITLEGTKVIISTMEKPSSSILAIIYYT